MKSNPGLIGIIQHHTSSPYHCGAPKSASEWRGALQNNYGRWEERKFHCTSGNFIAQSGGNHRMLPYGFNFRGNYSIANRKLLGILELRWVGSIEIHMITSGLLLKKQSGQSSETSPSSDPIINEGTKANNLFPDQCNKPNIPKEKITSTCFKCGARNSKGTILDNTDQTEMTIQL